jgi:MFS transporter, DHA1 family, multidrug resistance protein
MKGMLALLGALTAVGPLSLDMYLPALPSLGGDLGVSESQAQLTITACLIGIAAGQLFAGPLSDGWGRRRPVVAGVVAYSLATFLCALAPNVDLLIAARFVQGLAGGVGVVIARAIVRDLYSGVAAAKYFSRLVLVFGVAPIVAPSIGSAVLRVADWRGVFVVLGAVGALIALAVVLRLPETLPPDRRQPGGLRRIAGNAKLLGRDRVFIGYALTQGLAFAGMFSYIGGSSFVLQAVFGASSTVYGVIFGLNALGLVATGQLNARLLDTFAPRRLLVATLFVGLAAGLALIAAATGSHLSLFAVPLWVYIASIGLVLPNCTALALDRHPAMAGPASALIGASQSFIGALAAPVDGLVGGHRAVPMAAVIAVCAALALATVLLLARPPAAAPDPVA